MVPFEVVRTSSREGGVFCKSPKSNILNLELCVKYSGVLGLFFERANLEDETLTLLHATFVVRTTRVSEKIVNNTHHAFIMFFFS